MAAWVVRCKRSGRVSAGTCNLRDTAGSFCSSANCSTMMVMPCTMARRVAFNQAWGSMALSLRFSMSEASIGQVCAPALWPVKKAFLWFSAIGRMLRSYRCPAGTSARCCREGALLSNSMRHRSGTGSGRPGVWRCTAWQPVLSSLRRYFTASPSGDLAETRARWVASQASNSSMTGFEHCCRTIPQAGGLRPWSSL